MLAVVEPFAAGAPGTLKVLDLVHQYYGKKDWDTSWDDASDPDSAQPPAVLGNPAPPTTGVMGRLTGIECGRRFL